MSRNACVAALVGNPNAGKSALFNALTGARQKIANYPGVTVERKAGRLILPSGEPMELVDLPGSYGLNATSPDEEVTRKVIMGEQVGQAQPDVLVIVLDASNLEQHLVFAQEVLELGRPTVVALNMVDLAERDGLTLDPAALETALGVPVIPTVAVRRRGWPNCPPRSRKRAIACLAKPRRARTSRCPNAGCWRTRWRMARSFRKPPSIAFTPGWTACCCILAWSADPAGAAVRGVPGGVQLGYAFADVLDAGVSGIGDLVKTALPPSLARDLLTDGVIAGVGAVIVFLPQILILFFFILTMEATGYMARAAFLMDRLMATVGLSGRSFIPLLSSFACAIPGIMATRSITDPKDRLTTILIAPLMTCSARLPVYAVIIAAFIPHRTVGPGFGLQGLVLFGLYVFGMVGAMVVALVLRRSVTKGAASGFIMELPKYQLPTVKDLALGLFQRAWIFLRRAGTMIFTVTVVLWFLLNFPARARGRARWTPRSPGTSPTGWPWWWNRWLQPRYRAGDHPRHGRARSGGQLARHDLCRGQRERRGCAGERAGGSAQGALDAADRAGVPGLVRVRAAVHVDDRGHPARNERVEMAGVHARLPVRPGLSGGGRDLLDGTGLRAGVVLPRVVERTGADSPCRRALARPASTFTRDTIDGRQRQQGHSGRQSGADPEVRSFQNGGKVCNLRIATSETWKDRNRASGRNAPNGTAWRSSPKVWRRGRTVPAQGQQGLYRRPAPHPQVAGPVGQ
jgi:ferrous iron transport protein B